MQNKIYFYYYEGYEKLIHIEDTSGINLANINPFIYKSYYYDTETGWYYLNSRYYDPITVKFVTMDQVEYLGASGRTYSLNLFTYCEGNPVNYIDPSGTDAIIVIEFGDYGLPIFGHILLLIQDNEGKWVMTEFSGDSKQNAKVFYREGLTTNRTEKYTTNKIVGNRVFENSYTKGWKALRISGDFTAGLSVAEAYMNNQNYPSYNLFTNNCLDYALEILSYGIYDNKYIEKYINNFCMIVPSTFYDGLLKFTPGVSEPIYITNRRLFSERMY